MKVLNFTLCFHV